MSLRRRLFLRVFIPVAALYYALGFFGVSQVRGELIDDIDQDLAINAEAAAALLEPLDTPTIVDLITDTAAEGGSVSLTVLVDIPTGGIAISPTARLAEPLAVPDPESFQPERLAPILDQPFDVTSADGDLEYRAIATRIDGGRLIVVAEPLDRINSLTNRLLIGALITGLFILGAMAAVVFLAIRSGLTPLHKFVETTSRVAEGDLTERVDPEQPDPGFAQLATATNHMLDRIQHSYDQQRTGRQRLNQLINDAAHELRTPLTAIRGTIDMHRLGALNGDNLDTAIDGLDHHAARMTQLVEDLITIARAENHHTGDQSTSAVELDALTQQRVRALELANPERRITLEIQPDQPYSVDADAALLADAVDHLLDNAITHTNGTDIAARLTGNHKSVQLAIHDTGPGIPPDLQDRIFDRFTRTDPSRNRNSGGSGLGLAIAKTITEAAGGQLTLQTSPTTGTTFTIQLPLSSTHDYSATVQGERKTDEPLSH